MKNLVKIRPTPLSAWAMRKGRAVGDYIPKDPKPFRLIERFL